MQTLVEREIRTGERDGQPTKIAIVRRVYRTDQADLWNALTDAERIPRWFLPVSGSLEVGGRYQLEGNAGGVVERCDEPASFAATWEFGGMVSWVEVNLSPAADGTLLELVHEAHVDQDMWAQYGPGAVGLGWDLALQAGLARHIATGAAVDPAEGLAYPSTEEGREFVRRSADGWREAAIADGDDPTAAAEAADRAFAAYTTAPPQE